MEKLNPYVSLSENEVNNPYIQMPKYKRDADLTLSKYELGSQSTLSKQMKTVEDLRFEVDELTFKIRENDKTITLTYKGIDANTMKISELSKEAEDCKNEREKAILLQKKGLMEKDRQEMIDVNQTASVEKINYSKKLKEAKDKLTKAGYSVMSSRNILKPRAESLIKEINKLDDKAIGKKQLLEYVQEVNGMIDPIPSQYMDNNEAELESMIKLERRINLRLRKAENTLKVIIELEKTRVPDNEIDFDKKKQDVKGNPTDVHIEKKLETIEKAESKTAGKSVKELKSIFDSKISETKEGYRGPGMSRRNLQGADLKSAISQLSKQNMPPAVKDYLDKYGDYYVDYFQLCKSPVNETITTVLNLATQGKIEQAKKDLHIDRLFHTFAMFQLKDNIEIANPKIEEAIVEKNQRVYIGHDYNEPVEYARAIVGGFGVKFRDFIYNGLAQLEEWGLSPFDYDPIDNNCQVFLKAMLAGNGLANQDEFLIQDTKSLFAKLDPWILSLARGAVSAAQFGSILFEGAGKKKKRGVSKKAKNPYVAALKKKGLLKK